MASIPIVFTKSPHIPKNATRRYHFPPISCAAGCESLETSEQAILGLGEGTRGKNRLDICNLQTSAGISLSDISISLHILAKHWRLLRPDEHLISSTYFSSAETCRINLYTSLPTHVRAQPPLRGYVAVRWPLHIFPGQLTSYAANASNRCL